MITVSERLQAPRAADAQLLLPFDLRSRSRLRATLVGGEEVALMLARGQILRGGDLLRASDGRVIEVLAAAESVSTVASPDARLLARAAYHLGNRHVALQIGSDWLRYSHDHVLDAMLQGLGLRVVVEQAPFEPEAGAYHSDQAHDHTHSPSAHSHSH